MAEPEKPNRRDFGGSLRQRRAAAAGLVKNRAVSRGVWHNISMIHIRKFHKPSWINKKRQFSPIKKTAFGFYKLCTLYHFKAQMSNEFGIWRNELDGETIRK